MANEDPEAEDDLFAGLSNPRSEAHMHVDAMFGDPVDVDGGFDDHLLDAADDGIGVAEPPVGDEAYFAALPAYPSEPEPPMPTLPSKPARPAKPAVRSEPPGLPERSEILDSMDDLEPAFAIQPGLAIDDADLAPPSRPEPPPRPRPPAPVAKQPRGPWLGRLFAGVLLVGAGAGAWFGLRPLLERDDTGTELEAEAAGLRRLRVAGDDAPSHVGFRQHHMDKLATTSGILFSYVSSNTGDRRDPLTLLVDGEVEFALTTLDRVLERSATEALPGTIVAVVGVSVGADALILDSAEFPQLRGLGDLAPLGAKAELTPVLAHAPGTRGDSLDLQLGALLRAVHAPGVRHVGDYVDENAVFNALLADADEAAPVVAGVVGEPWVGRALDAGMSVALGTRELPRAVVDVLVVASPLLAEDPGLVEAVVGAYFAGLEPGAPSRAKLAAQIAEDMNLGDDAAARVLAGLCLFDASGARPWLIADADARPALADAVALTWTTLRAGGRVEGEAPGLDALVDARALASLDEAGEAVTLDACLAASAVKASRARALGELALPNLDPGTDHAWFTADEAVLTDAGASALGELALRLRAFEPSRVSAEITGYADASNKGRGLGQARAQVIVEALERAGATLELRARGASVDAPPASRISVVLTAR